MPSLARLKSAKKHPRLLIIKVQTMIYRVRIRGRLHELLLQEL